MDLLYSYKYISSTQNMKPTKKNSKSEFGRHKTCIMCLVLLALSLSESCNSAQKNKINQDRQSRALQRNSENCDIDLPYSSYQSLESLCNLCASYIRDYPELYGQCR